MENNIVFVPFESAYGYTESGQSVQARMAFLNKVGNTYTEMFLPVMCRDYLNDILHLEYWKLPEARVCGFSYDGRVPRIDRDQIRLSLQCASASGFAHMVSNLALILHPIETKNNFELTTIKLPSEKVLILEGDKRWLSSTITLSAYTLMLRIAGLPFTNPNNWIKEISERRVSTQDFTFFNGKMSTKFPLLLTALAEVAEAIKDNPPAGWGMDESIDSVHFKSGLLSGILGENPMLHKMLLPFLG